MASDEFAARAAKLFGSLDTQVAAATAGGGGGAWQLNTQQGFAAGAEDLDSSEDAGDAEDAEGGRFPQSLPGAAGSDEDEDEYKVRCFQLDACMQACDLSVEGSLNVCFTSRACSVHASAFHPLSPLPTNKHTTATTCSQTGQGQPAVLRSL